MSEANQSEIYEQRKQICKQIYQICTQPTDTFKFDNQFLQIWNLLEQLKNLEKNCIPSCCDHTQRNSKSIEDFTNFILKDKNCHIKIVQTGSDDQLGVQANQNFNKGELIAEIPENKILTLNCGDKMINKLMSTDKLVFLMPNVAMALLLLKLKTDKSCELAQKWQPYLKILPCTLNTPLFFTLDEIKLLQASHSFNEIILHIRSVARQYAYLFNLFDSKKGFHILKSNFSYENYKWCVSIVSTRQNEIRNESGIEIIAMIPLLEMCNHEFSEICTEYDVKTKSAKIYANKDLKSGDEVKIFYGKRSDKDMLIHNGFVCETNPNNSLILKLGVSTQDVLFKQRTAVLGSFGLSANEKFELTQSDDPFPVKLYFFVKVFLIKSVDELQQLYESKTQDIELYHKENDLKSDNKIKQFIKMRLQLMIRAHEQQNLKNQLLSNENKSINCLFIKRLLYTEINLIKYLVENI